MTWRRRAAGDPSRVGPHHEEFSRRCGQAARSGAGRRVRAVAARLGRGRRDVHRCPWTPRSRARSRSSSRRGTRRRGSAPAWTGSPATRRARGDRGRRRVDRRHRRAVAAARGARVVTAGAAPEVGRQALGAAARARGGARRHRRVRRRRHAPAPRVRTRAAALRAEAGLVSVGARFVCSTAGERWLHPGAARHARLSLRASRRRRAGGDLAG